MSNWALGLVILGSVSSCTDLDASSSTPTPTSTSTQAVGGQRKVIMFLWDGFPYSDINPTDTPNLWAMIQGGANFTDNHSTFPTFTMVNSASFATGAYPGRAGIYDNILWEPGPVGNDSAGRPVDYSQPVDLTDYAILTTLDSFYNNQLLLVGTLFQAAQDAGLTTATIGKSGPAFIQDYKRGGVILDEKMAWPLSFAQGMQGAGLRLPLTTPFAYPPGTITLSPNNGNPTAISATVTMADGVTPNPAAATVSLWRPAYNYLMDSYLNYVLPVVNPDVSFVWVRDPDGTSHTYGASAATRDGLRAQDAYLGLLQAKLAQLGIAGNTDILILADHGRSSYSGPTSLFPLRAIVNGQVVAPDPNGYSVSGEVRMADLLTRNGFTAFDGRGCGNSPVMSGITANGTRVYPTQIDTTGTICGGAAGARYTTPAYIIPSVLPRNAVVVAPNAGADFIHVPSGNRKLVERLVAFLQEREEIGAIFVRRRWRRTSGTLPLDLIRLENRTRHADIVVSYTHDENAVIQGNPGIEFAAARITPNWRGNHGTFSPADVHNVMIGFGPDFRAGFADTLPTGNVDAAPTVAHILGLRLSGADGRPLLEGLVGGDTDGYSVQATVIAPQSDAFQLTMRLPTSVTGEDVDPTSDTYTSTLHIKDLTTPNGNTYRYLDTARARRYLFEPEPVTGNNDLSVTLLPTPTHPDGPCFDNLNRYVNCGNGTVTDTVTGLIWLQRADCFANGNYSAANQAAAALATGQCSLTDKSSPGDWRLPTKDEWSATIARAVALGCGSGGSGVPPSLTNDAGTGCLLSIGGTSFAGVASGFYWSSSSNESNPANAWGADLFSGNVLTVVEGTLRVWPVRGGPR